METESDVELMKIVCNQCGFKKSFVVPNVGLSGGLALFWKSDIKIEMHKSSLSHIDEL